MKKSAKDELLHEIEELNVKLQNERQNIAELAERMQFRLTAISEIESRLSRMVTTICIQETEE